MNRQIILRHLRLAALILWLAGYRIFAFSGDVFYYLYYGFLDNFWPCFDVLWTLRKVRQEERIDEMKRRILKG